MASDCAHGDCGRFSANGAGGTTRKTEDEGKAAGKEGRACGDGRGNRSKRRDGARGWKKTRERQSRSQKERPRRSPFSPSASAPARFPGCSATRRPFTERCPCKRLTFLPHAFRRGASPRPALAPPLFPLPSLFLTLRPGRFRAPLHLPRAPARRFLSPPAAHKKRAEFPPRVFSCGPDAAAVHQRIRTCIQNEARRASRS